MYCGVCECFRQDMESALGKQSVIFGSFCEPKLVHLCTGGLKMNQLQCASRFSFLIVQTDLFQSAGLTWFDCSY